MNNTQPIAIPLSLSHFYELATQLKLMTTSYGGEFVVAGRGADRIEWQGYTPGGLKLTQPFALVPPKYEAAARKIAALPKG